MFVLTLDQRASRGRRIDVVAWARELNAACEGTLLLPFAQTLDDEIQAATLDPAPVVDCVLRGVRLGAWWSGVGVGSGEVEASAPSSRGPAYFNARDAVEAAKKSPYGFAVRGDDGPVEDVEACLVLLAVIVRKRGARRKSWEAVELRRQGLKLEAIANRLGVSTSAVHDRLTAASYDEEVTGRRLAERLLRRADGA